MADLSSVTGSTADALAFQILTTTRPNETLQARWKEFNLFEAVWEIPAERMKMRRLHIVPLAPQALAILKRLHAELKPSGEDYVFTGRGGVKPLANMAPLMLLRRMKHGHLTAHGFRATFKTWAREVTNHSNEAVEIQLAHKVGNATENAYWRSEMLNKRRALLNEWSAFCCAPAAAQSLPPAEE